MDEGNRLVDKRLAALERRMKRAYLTAMNEMRAKVNKHMERYSRELSERLAALDGTPEARKAHKAWLSAQAARREWMVDMSAAIADVLTDANKAAYAMVNAETAWAFIEGADFSAYAIEKAVGDVGFTLIDANTVAYLLSEDPQLYPQPKLNARKDGVWNRRKVNSAVTQGILQGESVDGIAKRLQSVADMNLSSAKRVARLAVTGAENAGRVESYKRAKAMGIDLKQEWVATMDGRTRHSHRQLDGEKVDVGEKFSNGCRFPGDPQGRGEEIWNCRCTLVPAIDGADQSDAERWSRLPDDMTYEEWKKGAAKAVRNDAYRIADPKWENAAVSSLETSADVKTYIEERHGMAVIGDVGKVPVERMRDIAAGFDDARARFGEGAANTLKINNRLGNLGKYNYDTGTIQIKASRGGTYLTAMHEYTHSVDDMKSTVMSLSSGEMRYNAYSDSLIDRACKRLGIKRGGREYGNLFAGMCGFDPVMRKYLSESHELLAYSVERVAVGRANDLSRTLVELLEADNA